MCATSLSGLFACENTQIYEMKLHDIYSSDNGNYKIIRVPGGWIYVFKKSSTFVPFCTEFQPAYDLEPPVF